MIPFYPENTKQLQQQGLLEMGMRFLQQSGPQQQGTGFGQRLGSAGVGTMQAMGQSGQRMMQMQAQQAKQTQAKAEHELRVKSAEDFKSSIDSRVNPLTAEENAAANIGYNALLSGKPLPSFASDTLYPKEKEYKFTSADRKAQLAKKMANNTATKEEKLEFDYLIQADPMDQLKRQIFQNYKPRNTPNADPAGIL